MIAGVKTKKLRVIPDERGRLMEVMRCDDEMFDKFGQTYISVTYPGVIKGWHMHKLQTDNIACVKGMLKLVLFDGRDGSPTKGEINEFFIGEHNPMLVQVPTDVYHGWKCISENEALAMNIPTHEYSYNEPDEFRLPYDTDQIPYDWDLKHG